MNEVTRRKKLDFLEKLDNDTSCTCESSVCTRCKVEIALNAIDAVIDKVLSDVNIEGTSDELRSRN